MPKLPAISGAVLIKALSKIGYSVVRQKGSHIRLHRLGSRPLTVPNHHILAKGLLRKILRDIDVSLEDFLHLL